MALSDVTQFDVFLFLLIAMFAVYMVRAERQMRQTFRRELWQIREAFQVDLRKAQEAQQAIREDLQKAQGAQQAIREDLQKAPEAQQAYPEAIKQGIQRLQQAQQAFELKLTTFLGAVPLRACRACCDVDASRYLAPPHQLFLLRRHCCYCCVSPHTHTRRRSVSRNVRSGAGGNVCHRR